MISRVERVAEIPHLFRRRTRADLLRCELDGVEVVGVGHEVDVAHDFASRLGAKGFEWHLEETIAGRRDR